MFLDGHSKIVTRVENCVQRAVHISFSVVDGRGSRDTESEGAGSRKQLNGGVEFSKRCNIRNDD